MENERSLTERFAAIESKLADSKVLLELGKAMNYHSLYLIMIQNKN